MSSHLRARARKEVRAALHEVRRTYEFAATPPVTVAATAPGEPTKPPRDTSRRGYEMKRNTIMVVVGSALKDGRIATEDCIDWVRKFEEDPEAATVQLALAPPDPVRAYRNYADDAQEKRVVSSLTGIPLEEVS